MIQAPNDHPAVVRDMRGETHCARPMPAGARYDVGLFQFTRRCCEVPMSVRRSGLAAFLALMIGHTTLAADTPSRAELVFKGKIGLSAKDSIPDWPASIKAPAGAPNIVLIILDDVGFGDTETFGGPVHTPVLNQLAAEGLRYNRFHTAAICSPTRAALLSGRNHHRVGYGEFGGVGYPGYDGIWKKNTISIAEVLKRNGYSTAAFGKWHNTPYQEITPVGPFDRWPTGLGFEYYYGNMLGLSSQWEPLLWRNTERVLPPKTPEQGYHYTTDITDEAICWIQTHESLAPGKPYFAYFSTGAVHVPLHVPNEWIEKYRGRFDMGWDKLREETFARQKKLGVVPANTTLTPRPKELPAWDSFPEQTQRMLARQMEVYAGFLAHTDHEIGRLIATIKAGPNADNTLILYIVGDNGAEPVGGITGFYSSWKSHPGAKKLSIEEKMANMDKFDNVAYAAAWAWAGNTPFQWTKHAASHFGGTRNPLIVSWPTRIKDHGGLRSQFTHVNDVAATLYNAAGIQFPEVVDGVKQLPLDGASFADSFDNADAPDHHRVQYFESEGNRAIYQDGWLAAARHSIPWMPETRTESGFERDRWELYNIERDFSQAHDLARRHPEKLRALQALFDEEAHKNNVYPLGAGTIVRVPEWAQSRKEFTYYEGFPGIWMTGGPDFQAPHRITANVVIPQEGAQGVIISSGGRDGGFTLYIKNNHLIYEKKSSEGDHALVASNEPMPGGRVELGYELAHRSARQNDADIGRLFINGRLVGETQLPRGAASRWGIGDPVDIGYNSPSSVSESYQAPFKFSGKIESVHVELD